MKHVLCLAAALTALLAGGAVAGQQRPADPADADAPVPPLRHAPATAPATLAPTPPPPQHWPALNAQVGASHPMVPAAAAPDPHAHHKAGAQ